MKLHILAFKVHISFFSVNHTENWHLNRTGFYVKLFPYRLVIVSQPESQKPTSLGRTTFNFKTLKQLLPLPWLPGIPTMSRSIPLFCFAFQVLMFVFEEFFWLDCLLNIKIPWYVFFVFVFGHRSVEIPG